MRLEILFDYAKGEEQSFRLVKDGQRFDKIERDRSNPDAQTFAKDMKSLARRSGVFVYDPQSGIFTTTLLSPADAPMRIASVLEAYARRRGGYAIACGAYDPRTGSCIPKPEAVTRTPEWKADELAKIMAGKSRKKAKPSLATQQDFREQRRRQAARQEEGRAALAMLSAVLR